MQFDDPRIPKLFFSDLVGKPIETCAFCSKFLLDDQVMYSIEKNFRNNRVDYEYAICFECASNLKSEMSEESEVNIQTYMIDTGFYERSRDILQSEEIYRVEDFFKQCMIKGTPVERLDEFQVVGIFKGPRLSEVAFPLIIGYEAIEEMNELLSAKTKGELDQFLDDLTGLPPEWKEFFKHKKPLLI
jgi:hypothetical protein